ncbi:E2 [Psittacus erithacus papillomavirus 1]|uniref:Protein E8^E2C n=2 Tax=Psittacus erithacus timneh papillomavirus TaxID=197772 RepID=Q8JJG6_PEPVA|nr:E2 [Psittacus erithacus papillomavirus 1]AAM46855.1 E2 [Psittacus erithacus papillomavirus 1]AAM75203.1 putative regulatory protein E2 [Thetapapillomavirus 1]
MEGLRESLERLQRREAEILEQDPTDLQTITEYWENVKKQHLLLYAAGQKGYKQLGLQRVPPLHVSEQEARDGILMVVLLRSLLGTPHALRTWSLGEWGPRLFRTPPDGLKFGPHTVRVFYCNDPSTETEYPYWDSYLFYDPTTGEWTEGIGGYDNVGIWHETINGRGYHMIWRDEARRVCGGNQVTWELSTSDRDSLDGIPPPLLESTRVESPEPATEPETPSPPQLSNYALGDPPNIRGGSNSARTRSRRIRTRGTGTDTPTGIRPEDVGTARTTVRGGGTRLDRLIAEAKDPPGLCFVGRTGQLKTIRYRVQTGPYNVTRISTTWHWIGDGEHLSRMIILFNDSHQREVFARAFRVVSGVRVYKVSLSGI